MLRLMYLGLCLQVALSVPLPATTAEPAVPAVTETPSFLNSNFPGNPAYAGYNGYRSPYYNPASATAPILSYSNNRGVDGSYSYSFVTADGKQAQESGFLKDAYVDNNGSPQGTQVVEGSYAYTSPEGTPIQVNYVADENGFRPAGIHIAANGKGVAPALLGNGATSGLLGNGVTYGSLGNGVAPGLLGNGVTSGLLGNGVAPGFLGNGFNNNYDPRYNRFNNIYDPRYNGFNPHHRNHFNQYNRFRPYDPRYNLYNPYRTVKDIKKFE